MHGDRDSEGGNGVGYLLQPWSRKELLDMTLVTELTDCDPELTF